MDTQEPQEVQPASAQSQPGDHQAETQPVDASTAPSQESLPAQASETPAPGGETSPVEAQPSGADLDALPGAASEEGDVPAGTPWRMLAVIGVLTLIIIASMSAIGGCFAGRSIVAGGKATQIAQEVKKQFDLGVNDMQATKYDLARQRLEWVIEHNPNYPGATDLLAKILLLLNTTATPTVAPTPTVTATPDMRSIEELFTQAQQLLFAGEWANAIDTLLQLRKDAPDYRAVDVDGMLYIALRNQGVNKIKTADLEGGTYDLALAEKFGPLDVEARSFREWAELYITGASFWEIDWPKVIQIFRELWQIVPYLSDSSGWTVTDRLRIGLTRYGDQLALAGEWCQAQEQYQAALELSPDPGLEPTAAFAVDQCGGGGRGRDRSTEIPGTPPIEVTPTAGPPPESTPVPTATTQPPPGTHYP